MGSIAGAASRLVAVERLLRRVPDLATIVLSTVGSIHPLAAEPGYDLSHSQPRWRDRIFVSFPERLDLIGDLRLAEAVVHEAMHLHLTNEESRTLLVAHPERSLYSPWMDTARSSQGVLHGVFVFRSVRAFLSMVVRTLPRTREVEAYVADRVRLIEEELSSVDGAALEGSLTRRGVELLRAWTLEVRASV